MPKLPSLARTRHVASLQMALSKQHCVATLQSDLVRVQACRLCIIDLSCLNNPRDGRTIAERLFSEVFFLHNVWYIINIV